MHSESSRNVGVIRRRNREASRTDRTDLNSMATAKSPGNMSVLDMVMVN
jgi:hypothetical protein